jgi:TolB-like protein/Tfp pilus assembly protein PilF
LIEAAAPSPAAKPTEPTSNLANSASLADMTNLPSAASRSVAVLPFANLDGQADQEYFSDGIAEDVISQLTRSPWLFVMARNSSFTYRNSSASVQEICRELQVRYLVTGTVRRVPGALRADGSTEAQVRVSAELVDGQRNETLWSKRFDSPLDDLLGLQEKIARQIVSTIEPVALRREEQRALQSASVSPNLAHWELLMQARWHFWRSTRENLQICEALLLQSLQAHPTSSASYSLLAFVHMSRVWALWAEQPRVTLQEAMRCAMSAVSFDDRDSHAHFTLGTALSCVGKMDQAIVEMQHALSLYPQAAAAAGELARLLAFSGASDEAHEYALQAIDASPHDPHLSLWVRTRAIACFVQGQSDPSQYTEGAHHAMQAIAKRPDWSFNHYTLAACQAMSGQLTQAISSLQTAQKHGSSDLTALRIGHPFVHAADWDRFTAALRMAGWQA